MRMIVGTPFVEVVARTISQSADEDMLKSVYDELKIEPPADTFVDVKLRISLLAVTMYHDMESMPGYVMVMLNDGTALHIKGEAKIFDVMLKCAYKDIELEGE